MAKTVIADLAIVPETFLEFVEKLIMERALMFQSGLVSNVPTYIPSKGTSTNAPAWLGFDGADEVLSDTGALTVNKVDSVNEVAAINFRGKAFGANDLVGQLAGSDPLGNLASKFADYWIRQYDKTLVSTLTGASAGLDAEFGAETVVLDRSGATIGANGVIDTKQLVGEYQDELSIMVCHSAIYAKLQKEDLTKDVLVDSEGSPIRTRKLYMGMEVVVDDNCPEAVGVYDTYICKPGAVMYSQGIDPRLAIETDRDILAGDDITTTRSRFILHPGGASFTGASVAGVSPTNVELATAANWAATDANEHKRFGIRVLKTQA